ncbi:MAG: hypothetical protein KY461_07065 [Actinobacteria bacterium]|nr:hypothetical protein [Actinomycetota bacterium]
MSVRSATLHNRSSIAGVILLLLALLVVTVGRADANHQPADKVVASGAIEDVAFVGEGEEVQLLEETFRTSTTSDLLLQIASECSITTEVTTIGNDHQTARGQLKYHLTIATDGGAEQPIGIGQTATHPTEPGTATDDGSVVFCDRKYERETTLFEDEEATIRTFMDTRTANAFNWVQLNAGKGIHTVRLYATYSDADTTDGGASTGVVGRRTMIIEPVKMKNDEHVQDVNVD